MLNQATYLSVLLIKFYLSTEKRTLIISYEKNAPRKSVMPYMKLVRLYMREKCER